MTSATGQWPQRIQIAGNNAGKFSVVAYGRIRQMVLVANYSVLIIAAWFHPLRLAALDTSPEFCEASLWGGGGWEGVLDQIAAIDGFANSAANACDSGEPRYMV
jgi:hypothetical protein